MVPSLRGPCRAQDGPLGLMTMRISVCFTPDEIITPYYLTSLHDAFMCDLFKDICGILINKAKNIYFLDSSKLKKQDFLS